MRFAILFAFVAGTLLAALNGAFAAEPLTVTDLASRLEKSAVAVSYGGMTVCSAAKIGPGMFLTAGHCVANGEHLVMPGGRIMKIKSVLQAQQQKASDVKRSATRDEDWAVLYTVEDDEDVPALPLACTEVPYLGQEVAYAGFPYPTQFSLGLGRVTSVKPVLERQNNLDFTMDVHAAPGASGSAVVSRDTGAVLGILTEGVFSKVGVFMVGFESIKNTDMCGGIAAPSAAAKPPVAPSADALIK